MTSATLDAPEPTVPPVRRFSPRAWSVTAARVLGGVLVVVGVTLAGLGWLYLLRGVDALRAGPPLQEALALQRLAGQATQPLARVAVAWLPAGMAGGGALYALGLRSRPLRLVVVFAGCALLLLWLGAEADAITASDPLSQHLAAQPQRVATWVAAGLAALGAAVPGRIASRSRQSAAS